MGRQCIQFRRIELPTGQAIRVRVTNHHFRCLQTMTQFKKPEAIFKCHECGEQKLAKTVPADLIWQQQRAKKGSKFYQQKLGGEYENV